MLKTSPQALFGVGVCIFFVIVLIVAVQQTYTPLPPFPSPIQPAHNDRCVFFPVEMDDGTILLEQELLVYVFSTMDLLFVYDGDLPLQREHNYYILRNATDFTRLMVFCKRNFEQIVYLRGLFRPKTRFYLEDRRLCNLDNANLTPHCAATTSLPIPCDAQHISPDDLPLAPNFEPAIAPFSAVITHACVNAAGSIYRLNHKPLPNYIHYGCGGFEPADASPPQMLNKPVVAIAATWSNAYYHWVGESVPRLGVVHLANYYVHTGKASPRQVRLLERIYGMQVDAVSGNVCAPYVIWPIPATCGHGIPSTLPTLRATTPTFSPNAHISIIYLHRNATEPRHFAQYKTLLNFLALFPAVVHTYVGDDYPMDVFNNANCVIGPHGAGFANLLFAPTGTKVVEILYSENTSVGFLPFALSIGMEWHGFVAEGRVDGPLSFGSDEALHYFLHRVHEICFH